MSDHTTAYKEFYEYGRLWPDGTFAEIRWSDEQMARREFRENSYQLRDVPESLRPVFGRRKVTVTTDTYTAEPVPEAKA